MCKWYNLKNNDKNKHAKQREKENCVETWKDDENSCPYQN